MQYRKRTLNPATIKSILFFLCIVVSLILGFTFASAEQEPSTNSNENIVLESDAIEIPEDVQSSVEYTIVIPQEIRLMYEKESDTSGEKNYTASFSIYVSGSIGSAQTLSIEPDGIVEMIGTGYANGDTTSCIISLDEDSENSFDCDSLSSGSSANYTASASFSPGDWYGYMDIAVTLDGEADISIKTYTIQYQSTSGKVLGTSKITGEVGESVEVSLPDYDGYTTPTVDTISLPESNSDPFVYLYTPVTYSVTYNLNNGTLDSGITLLTSYTVESDPFTVDYEPTRTDYQFAGWSMNNDLELSSNLTVPTGTTGDIVFVANWAGIWAVTLQNGTLAFGYMVQPRVGGTYTNPADETDQSIIKKVYSDIESIVLKIDGDAPWAWDSISNIRFDSEIVPVSSTAYWFSDMMSLHTIENPENLNTKNVTDMTGMFKWSFYISALDLSTWDVSKVTSFAEMFDFCYSMTELNVSNWDVSNALTMADMFNYCSALSVLDVSSFVPSSCTSFEETFANLYNVEEIRFGDNFDTSSATTMAGMFSFLYLSSKGEGYEKKLKSLDVSFLNTSNVTTMYQMFTNFDSLEELTLNGWDTSNVRNMGSMFANCSNLIMLDLTSFNTRQVSASEYIFSGCDNLTTILKSSDFTLATPV